MSDLGPAEIGGYVVGAGGAGKLIWDLLVSRAKKADELEDTNRKEEAADIKELLKVTQEIRRDMALFQQTLNTQAGVVAEVKGRVDGMSANYGGRLSTLEQNVAALASKIELLLERTEKRGRR